MGRGIKRQGKGRVKVSDREERGGKEKERKKERELMELKLSEESMGRKLIKSFGKKTEKERKEMTRTSSALLFKSIL